MGSASEYPTQDIGWCSHPPVRQIHQHGASSENRHRVEPRSEDSRHHRQQDDRESSEQEGRQQPLDPKTGHPQIDVTRFDPTLGHQATETWPCLDLTTLDLPENLVQLLEAGIGHPRRAMRAVQRLRAFRYRQKSFARIQILVQIVDKQFEIVEIRRFGGQVQGEFQYALPRITGICSTPAGGEIFH